MLQEFNLLDVSWCSRMKIVDLSKVADRRLRRAKHNGLNLAFNQIIKIIIPIKLISFLKLEKMCIYMNYSLFDFFLCVLFCGSYAWDIVSFICCILFWTNKSITLVNYQNTTIASLILKPVCNILLLLSFKYLYAARFVIDDKSDVLN